MSEFGEDRVFVDKLSGKDMNRPALQEMMAFAREGDSILVESISRFARNTKDLLGLVEQLKEKKVKFISKKENIDTNTPSGSFMLTVFAAIATLEREYILDRQKEGILIAKAEGKFKGRQPIRTEGFEEVYLKWKNKELTGKQAMTLLNLKTNTFYRRVAEHEKVL